MHDAGEGGELDDENVSGQRFAVAIILSSTASSGASSLSGVLITSSRSIVPDSLSARKTLPTSMAWAEILSGCGAVGRLGLTAALPPKLVA